MPLIFTGYWATNRSNGWESDWNNGDDSYFSPDTSETSVSNENDTKNAKYGSLTNPNEPSLTQNYKEEEGVWDP